MAFTTTPDPSCASSSIFNIFHMPCGTDASAVILHEIFGDVIASLVPGMVSFNKQVLIPAFIQNFNTVLLSGVLLLFAIIVIAGTVNTGHQGKFLGQQWDSIWTPLRVILGTACMVPLKYGIAAAQIVVLMFLLFGAHAATTVWHASLHDVDYGTPPTIPASGMDTIKQAIANDIVMETYDVLNNGFPTKTENLQPQEISFFAPGGTQIAQQAKKLFPYMCETALAYRGSDGSLLPIDKLTGQQLTNFNLCKSVTDDFLSSNKPYFEDSNVPNGSFAGHTGLPIFWVGNLPGLFDCSISASNPNGIISKGCFQNFNTAQETNHFYTYHIIDPDQGVAGYVSGTGDKSELDAAQREGWAVKKRSYLNVPNNADGGVMVNGAVTYVKPTKPNDDEQTLQSEIKTFVANNIANSKCDAIPTNGMQPPYAPPPKCSNDINSIIQAFNTYLQTHSGIPITGNKLVVTQDAPTAQDTSSNNMIPGTHTPLNSSWWNAGEVYLLIDQQMAKNLHNTLESLSNLTDTDGLPHFSIQQIESTSLVFTLAPWYYENTHIKAMQFNAATTLYSVANATTAPGLWTKFVQGYSHVPFYYTALSSLPASNSLALFMISQKINAQQLYVFQRLFQVMAANDMLGNDFNSQLPLKNAMDKIFTGLLGNNGGAVAGQITSLMNEVYNLGVTKPSYGMIGKNLSVIQNAQRTGMDMITTTINSVESVYNHYENQYQDLRNRVEIIGATSTATAGALAGAALAAGGFGSSGWAAGLGAMSEVTAQTGQMAVQITTMLKMSDILQSLMWLPVVIVVLTALFTAGVSFALMLPLMPFILFWAGQIAWILGCLEAVIAAPFLMMTLVLPGGHHFAGHSVPGLRMLLGIIFRPVLMVLGLLIGLVLTYIVISFSADAFHVVAVTLIGGTMGGSPTPIDGIIPNTPAYQDARGVVSCLMLFLYCSFLMLAFQKCFSPIYLLPEKVTQMMGGQADKAGEQDLQQLQQGVSQQSQSLAQSGGQAMNKGVEAQQQKTQAQSRGWESGAGTSSKPYGSAKQGLYDKSNWSSHFPSKNGQAGLGQGNPGGGGGGKGGPDTQNPQNNSSLQSQQKKPSINQP